MRLVSLTFFAHDVLSAHPKADWKSLTDGLRSKDLVNQVSTYNSMVKPKEKVSPHMDKEAMQKNIDDELQKKMAERELKMQAHHEGYGLKKQVQAVMSADKQLKYQMEQKIKEKELRDKARHEKLLKEKIAESAGAQPKARKAKAAATKRVEEEEEPLPPMPKEEEEPLPEMPKAPPRKKLRAPVVVSQPEEPEVEQEVSIPRAPPAPRRAPEPEQQPAATIKVVHASQDELPMPSWGSNHDDANDNGASARKIGGNPWNDVGGKRQHKQSDADAIEKQVEEQEAEELKVGHLPKLPTSRTKKTHRQVVKEADDLASHFENGNGIARFSSGKARVVAGAPAPGPGPAPGPVPWTEDPEWMIDGARGDKTRTAPIGVDIFKGLASVPQPEQGFHGRPIVHEDMETMTGDWGSEFGPRGPVSAYKVCKEHPRSYWCRTHLKELSAGEEFGGLAKARAPAADDDEEEDEPDAPASADSPPWKKSGAAHMNVLAILTGTTMIFLAM